MSSPPWIYQGKEFKSEDHPEAFGFVYVIVNTISNKRYIGRKFLFKTAYKQVNKKRKRIKVASDWENYYGSNAELLSDVQTHGKECFQRFIVKLCKSRSECQYIESKFIFENDAIINENFYNSWISCRIHGKNVKGLDTSIEVI